MAKTEILNTRVDPIVKQEAMQVLNQIGLPLSIAIDIYLKQIAFSKGIPFELTIPEEDSHAYKENRIMWELRDAAKREALEKVMMQQAKDLGIGFGEAIEEAIEETIGDCFEEDFEEDETEWQMVDG